MERPRKKGARFTGVDIMADEVVEEVSLNFEEKRDRWNGYNPDEQLDSIREWEVVEAQRKIKREAESKERKAAGEDDGEASDASESDDEKYAEGVAEPVQKKDMKAKDRVTVKNLRIREDTAKYLLNLDVDSSHYDPKTRSMRENPNMGEDLKNLTYTGDNFYRSTGDTSELARQQVFAWDAAKHNADVHMQGMTGVVF
jgi:pre-mRNA-processing factor SLU7